MKLAMLFMFSFLGLAAHALPPPETMDDAVRFLPGLYDAAASSNWLAFGAGVAMILTFVIKKFLLPKLGLGTGLLPWVSFLVGALAGYGGAVLAGATFQQAILGLLSGPVASLLWDAIGQYFVEKKA